jgi:hypothetical protein
MLTKTNAMKQNTSWDASSCSASQEIPRLLWNPIRHYCVRKNPTLILIPSQINPVHTLAP